MLREELRYFSPLIRDVIVEPRFKAVTKVDPNAATTTWWSPVEREEFDVFIIIVDDLPESLFDAIPNNWYGTPVEVFLNGAGRKRLM